MDFPHGRSCTCEHCWVYTSLLPFACEGCGEEYLRCEVESCWPAEGERGYLVCGDCRETPSGAWPLFAGFGTSQTSKSPKKRLRPSALAERLAA